MEEQPGSRHDGPIGLLTRLFDEPLGFLPKLNDCLNLLIHAPAPIVSLFEITHLIAG